MSAFLIFLSLTASAWIQPRNSSLAIVNKDSGELTVLNLADRSRTVYQVGFLPHETAVAQGKVFVSNYGSAHVRSSALKNNPGNTLSVVTLKDPTHKVRQMRLGPERCAPHGLAVSKDQKTVFVTCELLQKILAIDVATETIRYWAPTNQAGTHMLAVSSDEAKAFTANFFHGTVSVIDLKDKKILAQISTFRGTEGITLSNDEKSLYASSPVTNEVIKINTSTYKEDARTNLKDCKGAVRVVAAPDRQNLLVVNCSESGLVQFVDGETLKVILSTKVGKSPIGISVPGFDLAYTANMGDGTISVINLLTGRVDETIPAGEIPDGIYSFPNDY